MVLIKVVYLLGAVNQCLSNYVFGVGQLRFDQISVFNHSDISTVGNELGIGYTTVQGMGCSTVGNGLLNSGGDGLLNCQEWATQHWRGWVAQLSGMGYSAVEGMGC